MILRQDPEAVLITARSAGGDSVPAMRRSGIRKGLESQSLRNSAIRYTCAPFQTFLT